MTRIAVALSGLPRVNNISAASWGRVIGRYSPDVYIHTWANNTSRHSYITDQLTWIFKALTVKVEPFRQIDESPFPDRHWPFTSVSKSLSMWHGIRAANDIVKESGKEYDLIIRGRMDWHIHKLDLINFDGIVLPDDDQKHRLKFNYKDQELHGYNDAFAYGKPQWMDRYVSTLDEILTLYRDEGVDYCPENFLTATLIKYNVPILLQHMEQHLIRNDTVLDLSEEDFTQNTTSEETETVQEIPQIEVKPRWKMKIGIYCPAKNEVKHVEEWYNSCKEADIIVCADTGSTDGTKEKMTELGVKVTDLRIIPWRFDDAFNFAMALLPDDIDVCIRLDLDERLQPGWREALEKAWKPETTRLRYPYVWNWNPDGTPGRQWYSDRIHHRNGFRWMGATHEGLCSRVPEVQTFTDDVKIYQYPDAKDKKHDLPLLLEATKEYPTDARLKAYLGREYLYRQDMEKCIETYKEFLSMSWDKTERGQAMINLSIADSENKVFWLKMAAFETPGHREPLTNLAQHYYHKQDWSKCYKHAIDALKITNHPMDYTCTPEAWGYLPHDLASIAAWNLGMYKESLEQAELALERSPDDVRLQNNLKLVKEFVEEKLSNE